MINAFFRPAAKRAPEEVVSRPASPPHTSSTRSAREPWTLIDDRSSASIEASVPSLSDLDDHFDETPTHTPTSSPPGTQHSTPGLPAFWALGSPQAPALDAPHPQLVMPTPLASLENLRAHQTSSSRASSPALPDALPVRLQPAAALSFRNVALPVGSAIAASCATLAYHAVGSIVAASFDALPTAAVPVGITFLAANYPMASLIGSAAGSLWGLQYLCRQGGASGNVRASRTSMCVSALTTSFWLFSMGPAAVVGSAGSVILDLAQPAAQTYLLSALGLIYSSDLFNVGDDNNDQGPRLLLQPQDVEELLAQQNQKQPEESEPS